MGGITEIATSAPGYSSVLPNNKAPLATTLKLNGYATAQFGKCHEVPVWQTSPAGPFDAWPTGGGGFEYFYGFIGGENNQWDPALYEGTTPIEPPKTPEEGYHLTEDLADKAITWRARQQKALLGDKPLFMSFCPGGNPCAASCAQRVDRKIQGQVRERLGQAAREITFQKQKELGVIPQDAVLTPVTKEIPAWDDMDPKLQARAGTRDGGLCGVHGAHRLSCWSAARCARTCIDDTLVYLIIGDNGASAEGTLQAAFNEMAYFNGMAALETPEFMMSSWMSSAAKGRMGTLRWAGHGRWMRRTNGPSKSLHIGAARATAPSCIGPTASRKKAACAASSRM